jgi:type I site-specific restriction endonuclease
MPNNEAHARIKINNLLEEAGWRFFDNHEEKANILLENHVKITQKEADAWGNDFETIKSGSLDFLLLDSDNKPICVLEAKKRVCTLWLQKNKRENMPTLLALSLSFFQMELFIICGT